MKEPLLFSGFLQTDYVELAHCFTPLQSDVLRKKKRKRSSACEVWNYFCKAPTSSTQILEKYVIKHWPEHELRRPHDCYVGVSKQSGLRVSIGSWHGNYRLRFMLHGNSATWSMMDFHHHPELCRQVEELRSRHVRVPACDGWLNWTNDSQALNCPLPVWCPLECDASSVARSERDLVAVGAAQRPSVCYSEHICPHKHSIITPPLIDVEHSLIQTLRRFSALLIALTWIQPVRADGRAPGRFCLPLPPSVSLTGECWSVACLQSRYSGDRQNSDGGQGAKRAMAEIA